MHVQVHRVQFSDSEQQYAIAALRKRVEDEALASLDALKASEDLQTIASRLGVLRLCCFVLAGW